MATESPSCSFTGSPPAQLATGSGAGWLDLLSESGFRVIALDFPSQGQSQRVTEDARCSTATLASDVLALLDHLVIPKAPLIGFSIGGGVALRVAFDFPRRVTKLVIAGVGDTRSTSTTTRMRP